MILHRYEALPTATMGIINLPGQRIHTLELPWRNNRPNVSCVPEGWYELKMHYGQEYRGVYRLKDVQGRTGILFHAGNWPHEIQGCILVGLERNESLNSPMLFQSRKALGLLNDHLRSFDRPEVRICWSSYEAV